MAGLVRQPALALVQLFAVTAALGGLGTAVAGCASPSADPRYSSGPSARAPADRGGTTHIVRRGDNLYRIGQRYGVSAETIRRANKIRNVRALAVGQQLWIPSVRARSARTANARHAAPSLAARLPGARLQDDIHFSWPVSGKLTSRYGSRRGRHEGIDISAPRGTDVFASEAGKVVFAGRMRDYGKMVVVKHAGNYRSVYAHVKRFHVREGHFVESGERIAEVGTTGNATGPHLHFEIRDRDRPLDPMLYLP